MLLISVFCVPHKIFAATVSFKTISSGTIGTDSTVVEVRVDPQSKQINVVEGVISIQGAVPETAIIGVENGESVLKVWPVIPQYMDHEKIIRFTGGVPGGFDQESLLLRIRFSPAIDAVTISWLEGAAYLNDGQGTKETIRSESVTVQNNQIESGKIGIPFVDSKKPYNAILIGLVAAILFVAVFLYVYKRFFKK